MTSVYSIVDTLRPEQNDCPPMFQALVWQQTSNKSFIKPMTHLSDAYIHQLMSQTEKWKIGLNMKIFY